MSLLENNISMYIKKITYALLLTVSLCAVSCQRRQTDGRAEEPNSLGREVPVPEVMADKPIGSCGSQGKNTVQVSGNRLCDKRRK